MKHNNNETKKAEVFFKRVEKGTSAEQIAHINLELLMKIKAFDKIKENDFVAIKLHFGEKGNTGHIKPETVKRLADNIKSRKARPFLVETSTLYVGERSNAYDHINIAYRHGFTFEKTGVPIIMADGLLGSNQSPVPIDGKHYKEVFIASDVLHYDYLICLSHVTGHIITGMGAAIKNMGMGLTARGGKLSQHSNVLPSITAKKCTSCGRCSSFCPAQAISPFEKSYKINSEKCIGCGECLSVCKFDAIKFSWKQSSAVVQEKMAEHALGVTHQKHNRLLLANHLIHVTKECDCMAKNEKCIIEDIGIAASSDPVALDKATIDITSSMRGYSFNYEPSAPLDPLCQLKHGEKIGLGTMNYQLIEI